MENTHEHRGTVELWSSSDGSILECCICKDTFTDPRILPCLHTFCLKCLERTGAGKRPGDFITCPLCRTDIQIPGRGFTEFQPNTFVKKLRDVSDGNQIEKVEYSDSDNDNFVEAEDSMQSELECVGKERLVVDVNQTDAVTSCTAKEPSLLVVGHCIECDQSLCENCSHAHGRIKVSKHHKVKDLNKKLPCEICSSEDEIQTPTVVFCKECEQLLCDGCFKTHRKLKVTKNHHLVNLINKPTCDACSNTDEDDETEVKSAELEAKLPSSGDMKNCDHLSEAHNSMESSDVATAVESITVSATEKLPDGVEQDNASDDIGEADITNVATEEETADEATTNGFPGAEGTAGVEGTEVTKVTDEADPAATTTDCNASSHAPTFTTLDGDRETETPTVREENIDGVNNENITIPSQTSDDSADVDDRNEYEQKMKLRKDIERNRAFYTMERLSMNEYYTSKMTWKNLVSVRTTDKPHQKGFNVITKLVMLDYRGPIIRDRSRAKSVGRGSVEDKILNRFKVIDKNSSNEVHPMDVINVIFNCCDIMLLQILTAKLFTCRMSVPILLPDIRSQSSTFLLWSLRGIVPEWKDGGKLNQLSLVDIKQPIISFIRIGKLKRSKSDLVNHLLGGKHNTFFHRDCENGNLKRIDSNGTVESSWYLPSENKNAKFKKIFTILNLRGDAVEYINESQLIFQMSSITFLMISVTSLSEKSYMRLIKDCATSKSALVLNFISDSIEETRNCSDDLIECYKQFEDAKVDGAIDMVADWQGEEVLNFDEWKEQSENAINKVFKKQMPEMNSLTGLADIARLNGFNVDEDDSACQEGHEKANQLLDPICNIKATQRRIKLLPLQGKLWKEWGRLQKRQHREKKMNAIEEFIARMNGEQKVIRGEQLKTYVSSTTSLSRDFIECLLSSNPTVTLYYISWLKVILDDFSRQTLPDLHHNYHKRWTDNRKEGATNVCSNAELNAMEKTIADASFGLEHILREMGQIYEAAKQSPDPVNEQTKLQVDMLPTLVANLLLNGTPFELMDGDAAFVPVMWVKAVFGEIQKIIGNQKLFVVSVVGIQSSGKSTLLNTMFGLQFAVSAGRCTKGVYCQLVSVDKENTKIQADYILVVDTEGLRAPELQDASRVRDNELATFVIGLGDVTLINIKGEIVADIQDVLQIVIHAMLRIKLVNDKLQLKPKCIFIHQNVTAVSAEEKMKFGHEKFHTFLDRMTKAAADQENVCDCTRFDQVIQFDETKHIFYVPDLWLGEPPMATVNCAYSEKVEKLKTTIMNDCARNCKEFTFNKFMSRISDLWNAILCENFVFNFKNSEEVRAFLNLDAFYSSLSWDMKNKSLKLQNVAINEILSSTGNPENIKRDQVALISKDLQEFQETLQNDLQNYFEENENKDILEQWKGRYTENFINLCKDEQVRISRDLNKYCDLRNRQLKNENAAKSYREKVFNLAKQTANDLKVQSKKMNEEELNDHFEKAWSTWISELASTLDDEDDAAKTVVCIFHKELYQTFQAQAEILSKALVEHPLESLQDKPFQKMIKLTCEDLSYSDEKGVMKLWRAMKQVLSKNSEEFRITCMNAATSKCFAISDEIRSYLRTLAGRDFQENQVTHIIHKLITFFRNIESNRTEDRFNFQLAFKIRLIVQICQWAATELIELKKCFRETTDPLTPILQDKPVMLQLFINSYFDIANDEMVAHVFLDLIQKWTTQTVSRDVGRLIANHAIIDDSTFQTKQTFLRGILQDLCESGDFSEYIDYLHGGESFLKQKISEYITWMTARSEGENKSKFEVVIHEEVDAYTLKIVEIFKEIETVDFQNQEDYFENLLSRLRKIITCPAHDIQIVLKMQSVRDHRRFTMYLKKCVRHQTLNIVNDVMKDEHKFASGISSDPEELLASKVLGCTARCPFCRAPCCLTEKNHSPHDHRALQHYPVGISGLHERISRKLCVHNCQSAVDSEMKFRFDHKQPDLYEPFKEYRKYYPDWEIAPDRSMEASLYWKWFMTQYHDDLVEQYGLKHADIPDGWRKITIEEALESLNNI